MKTTMTFGGIGPKLALMNLPYVILSLVMMQRDPEFMNLEALDCPWVRLLGFIWLAAGFLFWISSAWVFLHDFKTGKLITRGPFACCRNPIYASMILFIIPALGIIFHSGLILSIALVLYIGFKIAIHGESILLKRTFGNEYEKYEKSVNELFPFPWNILKRK
ncbi:MAG TPA: methyltransferase [Prolixibacteraceae bacterium]|nr:methyltransferase [Prolixibacteraceae bacterium]